CPVFESTGRALAYAVGIAHIVDADLGCRARLASALHGSAELAASETRRALDADEPTFARGGSAGLPDRGRSLPATCRRARRIDDLARRPSLGTRCGHQRIAGVDRVAEHRTRIDRAAFAVAVLHLGQTVLVPARAPGPVAAAAQLVATVCGAEIARRAI